jgi:hypothetical protein
VVNRGLEGCGANQKQRGVTPSKETHHEDFARSGLCFDRPPAAYAEDAKPADRGATKLRQATEQSYLEEKAQEKALKEGKAWTK